MSEDDLPNVAFVGKMGAGKTLAATHICEAFGYSTGTFATHIRHHVAQIWGEDQRNNRHLLQSLGNSVRAIDELAWVNLLMRDLDVQTGPLTVDDCRLPPEYWALRERSFYFIRIEAPEELRIDRLQRNGKLTDLTQLNDVSEHGFDDGFLKMDAVISNEDNNMGKFCATVEDALFNLRRRT